MPNAMDTANLRRKTERGLARRLTNLGEGLIPGPHTREGAEAGVVAALLLFAAFLGSRLRTGLSVPVDVVTGVAIGYSLMMLSGPILGLATRLLQTVPRFLGLTGMGALALFILLTIRFGMPPLLILFFAAAYVGAAALLGAALYTLTAPPFREAKAGKKVSTISFLLVGLACLFGLWWWFAQSGTDTHLVKVEAATPVVVPALDAADPSQPGPYAVQTLTYGSGSDQHRLEYGEDAELKTNTVDATLFVKGYKGWRRKIRDWYWGFGPKEYPLNGRVWYPEGDGPFPLVLIVHGNHNMAEYSDPGYAYLGELLASRGFILVSVDENFLNGSFVGGVPKENDARAWILLQHLKVWRDWNQREDNPFYGKVDLENIGLIGHSRGGEAVAIAAAFNRLPHYPDDATLLFDFGFTIKALIAIAPSDGQYRPADKRTPLEDVNYLLLQGGHDSDVSLYLGDRQFTRVRFTDGDDWFKASVWIYQANHGQFNTVWGRTDYSPPTSWLLNLKPLLDEEEQLRAGKVLMAAFLETTLHEDARYRALFRDHRVGRSWLPETLYLTRFEDASFYAIADFEEDLDVTTTTLPGGSLVGEHLAVWQEKDIRLRDGSRRETNGVYLGWREDAEKKDSEVTLASYSISLPARFGRKGRLGPETVLVFNLSPADEKLPAKEEDEETSAGSKEEAREVSKEAGDEVRSGGERQVEDDGKEPEPLDFTVELVTQSGVAVSLPLSHFRRLHPLLKSRFTKADALEKKRYESATEPILQFFELPLSAFVEAEPAFQPDELVTIRLVFDLSLEGVIILDRVGFAEGSNLAR